MFDFFNTVLAIAVGVVLSTVILFSLMMMTATEEQKTMFREDMISCKITGYIWFVPIRTCPPDLLDNKDGK